MVAAGLRQDLPIALGTRRARDRARPSAACGASFGFPGRVRPGTGPAVLGRQVRVPPRDPDARGFVPSSPACSGTVTIVAWPRRTAMPHGAPAEPRRPSLVRRPTCCGPARMPTKTGAQGHGTTSVGLSGRRGRSLSTACGAGRRDDRPGPGGSRPRHRRTRLSPRRDDVRRRRHGGSSNGRGLELVERHVTRADRGWRRDGGERLLVGGSCWSSCDADGRAGSVRRASCGGQRASWAGGSAIPPRRKQRRPALASCPARQAVAEAQPSPRRRPEQENASIRCAHEADCGVLRLPGVEHAVRQAVAGHRLGPVAARPGRAIDDAGTVRLTEHVPLRGVRPASCHLPPRTDPPRPPGVRRGLPGAAKACGAGAPWPDALAALSDGKVDASDADPGRRTYRDER